jgi:hypothetical protein
MQLQSAKASTVWIRYGNGKEMVRIELSRLLVQFGGSHIPWAAASQPSTMSSLDA